jgi:(4S)-4-hydroxy-5-phosphonooxypentane-2,3-dione isomerase
MIVTCVHIFVKPENIEAFKEATIANHTQSVQEIGNLRFDLLQDAANPSKFMIYEAYESDEAAVAHKTTEHYAIWRDTVASMMAEPRNGVKYNIVAPTDKVLW